MPNAEHEDNQYVLLHLEDDAIAIDQDSPETSRATLQLSALMGRLTKAIDRLDHAQAIDLWKRSDILARTLNVNDI